VFTEDGAVFTALSGALDGAYDWFTDPTLIVGKGAQVARAMDAVTGATTASRLRPSTWFAKAWDFARDGKQRAGLAPGSDSLVDQAGVQKLLRTDEDGNAVTAVGKGWQRYLSDAADWRTANEAGDEAQAAGIWAAMSQRYGSMMSLFDEINGARVIADAGEASGFRVERLTESALGTGGKPIEDLGQLSEHLTSTNGLIRINNGWAARKEMVMPGRLSAWAERRAAADTHRAKETARWADYTDPNLLPNEREQEILARYGDTETVRAGLAQARLMDRSVLTSWRAFRAKNERVYRRLSSQIPSVRRSTWATPAPRRSSSSWPGPTSTAATPPGSPRPTRPAASPSAARSCAARSTRRSTPPGCPAPRRAATSWSATSATSTSSTSSCTASTSPPRSRPRAARSRPGSTPTSSPAM
jgi:hypothetical protein